MKNYEVGVINVREGNYCLTITAEDTHVSFSTWDYSPHGKGNKVDISIFGNSLDNIVELARAILDAHAKIIHEGS